MYEISLINPLRQFGELQYTLIFHDPAGLLPDCRLERCFNESVAVSDIAADVVSALDDWVEILNSETEGQPYSLNLAGQSMTIHQIGGENIQWRF